MPKAKCTYVPSKVTLTVAGCPGLRVVTPSITAWAKGGPRMPCSPWMPCRPLLTWRALITLRDAKGEMHIRPIKGRRHPRLLIGGRVVTESITACANGGPGFLLALDALHTLRPRRPRRDALDHHHQPVELITQFIRDDQRAIFRQAGLKAPTVVESASRS